MSEPILVEVTLCEQCGCLLEPGSKQCGFAFTPTTTMRPRAWDAQQTDGKWVVVHSMISEPCFEGSFRNGRGNLRWPQDPYAKIVMWDLNTGQQVGGDDRVNFEFTETETAQIDPKNFGATPDHREDELDRVIAERDDAEARAASLADELERMQAALTAATAPPAQVEEGAETKGEQAGEPIPDPLARLVPNSIADEERLKWLRDRWQSLTHRLVDGGKSLEKLSPVEILEHQELERYRGLFT